MTDDSFIAERKKIEEELTISVAGLGLLPVGAALLIVGLLYPVLTTSKTRVINQGHLPVLSSTAAAPPHRRSTPRPSSRFGHVAARDWRWRSAGTRVELSFSQGRRERPR